MNPWMCASQMGMVFCPADYQANMGSGFSLLFKSWVISDQKSYSLACFRVCLWDSPDNCCRPRVPTSQRFKLAFVPLLTRTAELAVNTQQAALLENPPYSASNPIVIIITSPLSLLVVDTLLFAASLLLAYLNMLVAMAYDIGLLSSLVAGEAVTYFVVRGIAIALGGSGVKVSSTEGDCPCTTA